MWFRGWLRYLPIRAIDPLELKADLVVIGLGNPGRRFAYSRHNAGVLAVGAFCELCKCTPFRPFKDGLVSLGQVGDRAILFVLPRLPMNMNGRVASQIVAASTVTRNRILVVHDDEDIPSLSVRVSASGDIRSHRGLASVAAALGGSDFPRIRVGIGRRPEGNHHSYFLQSLAGEERDLLLETAAKGAAAAFAFTSGGLIRAQNLFNGSPRSSDRIRKAGSQIAQPSFTAKAPILPPNLSAIAQIYGHVAGRALFFDSSRLLFTILSAYRATLIRNTRLVVVIGTFGKTSTCRAIAAALDIPRVRPGQIHGANAFHLLAMQSFMVPPGRSREILEVGIDRPGSMEGYGRALRPDIVVWTCVGSEHHNSFTNNEEKCAEKARMLLGVKRGGVLVANGDDPLVDAAANGFDGQVIRYGLDPKNDVYASDINIEFPHGTRCMIHAGGASCEAFVPFMGEAMIRSIVAATAVAQAESIDLEMTVERLSKCQSSPSRLELLQTPVGAWILDDSHKGAQETIESALDLLSQVPDFRRTVVLGDVEEPTGVCQLHQQIGARVARSADRLIFIGSQHHKEYRTGALRAGMSADDIFIFRGSLEPVIRFLRNNLGPKDVLLLKGRSTDRLMRIRIALMEDVMYCYDLPCPATRVFKTPCVFCNQLQVNKDSSLSG